MESVTYEKSFFKKHCKVTNFLQSRFEVNVYKGWMSINY